MIEPRVSVIIPVFDGERYLGETIASVREQTHSIFEILVVDDGSTDRSAEIAGAFAGVRCIRQENSGHAAARNRGLAAVTGDLIAFVDADDLWHREKIARQVARLTARRELGVVFTHLENFWSPDADRGLRPADEAFTPVPGYTSVTMLARAEVFRSVGRLDESLRHGNDREWLCRAAEQKVVMEMMPDVLVRRRLHASNRSAAHGDSSRAEYLRILKASLDRRRSEGGSVAPYPFQSDRGSSQ